MSPGPPPGAGGPHRGQQGGTNIRTGQGAHRDLLCSWGHSLARRAHRVCTQVGASQLTRCPTSHQVLPPGERVSFLHPSQGTADGLTQQTVCPPRRPESRIEVSAGPVPVGALRATVQASPLVSGSLGVILGVCWRVGSSPHLCLCLRMASPCVRLCLNSLFRRTRHVGLGTSLLRCDLILTNCIFTNLNSQQGPILSNWVSTSTCGF